MADSAQATPHFGPPMGNVNSHISNINANINAAGLGQAPRPIPEIEPIEWAKFCMWLRGYLGAVEGKQLTADDTAKIMEKLATVDPESQSWRYGRGGGVRPQPFAPFPPLPPVSPIYPTPQWTISTTDGTNEAATSPKIMCGVKP